ncbi:MAG: ATP-grasp domain-containing protein [Alphaproteobacteria bacterium]|nr:ATP-grasp domain-containing protein [Alphaproteobacteria bacterium]
MRVLVLHSDVAPDAPPDEQDTLVAADAVADALASRGHRASLSPFVFDLETLRSVIAEYRPDVVFNMVEAIFRHCELAAIVPTLLEKLNVPYTGCPSAPMAMAGDKPLAKKFLRLAGLPTPDWDEVPYNNTAHDVRYVVKSATEDASLGLDGGAVVTGRDAVLQRAGSSHRKHGGRWFVEAYIEGREFNISVLEENGEPRVLPIPEMVFHNWDANRPRIVGYDAKWSEASPEYNQTIRQFRSEAEEPALYRKLTELSTVAWRLFRLKGFARVDFRVSEAGEPFILEINPNPCLEPGSGFAAAAEAAGMDYAEAIERILAAALATR